MVHARYERHWATRRVRWFRLAAFLLGGSSLGSAPAAAQIAVDQAEIFLEPRTAGRGVASINVSNEGDTVIEASVYVSDWERRDDGEHRFYQSGTLRQSCGGVLRVFPLSLRLTPHAAQAVRIALEGADTLSAACWSVVFVESGGAPQRGGRQASYVTRVGAKVYGIPPGLARDGGVDSPLLRTRGRGPGRTPADTRRGLALAFRHSGGMPLWGHGKVEFRRLNNAVAATADVPEFPVLPGALRRVAVALPALARGRYVALALLDYGGSDIAGAQVVVEVP